MPLVSIIIPNFNHERFLKQRLDSVINQSFQDFEILFLDDASSDDSLNIVSAYRSNPRFRFFENRINSGSPFTQWNRGIEHAKGKYIWIAESDDYADPSLLETLVNRLEGHANVGLAYCQSLGVDQLGNTLFSHEDMTHQLDPKRWGSDFQNKGNDECSRYLFFQNTIPNASAVLFKKTLFKQVGGADETMHLCGDWLLWTKILMKSDVDFTSRPLNFHRTHSDCVRSTSDINRQAQERWQVRKYILENTEMNADMKFRAAKTITREWLHTIKLQQKRFFANHINFAKELIELIHPKQQRVKT